MAISLNLIDATTAAVAGAGTSVAPTLELPDNCHTMVVLNPSSTATVYMNFGTAGLALAAASSVNILPNTSVSLAVGTRSDRASSGIDAIFDCSAGAVDVRIFYVNGAGG